VFRKLPNNDIKITTSYDISYTSPFWAKNGSLVSSIKKFYFSLNAKHLVIIFFQIYIILPLNLCRLSSAFCFNFQGALHQFMLGVGQTSFQVSSFR
jgi:hypothetical protein